LILRAENHNTYSLTLKVENPRPTLVLLDSKARIMFTSTTQRSGPSITQKAGQSRKDLLQAKKIIKI
jgi:hypothetical protein